MRWKRRIRERPSTTVCGSSNLVELPRESLGLGHGKLAGVVAADVRRGAPLDGAAVGEERDAAGGIRVASARARDDTIRHEATEHLPDERIGAVVRGPHERDLRDGTDVE